MKNKFIFIFLILIFNLSSINLTAADEFNFDVTELQIYENGNIIKGINGGIATTKNNEIVITANNFKYNKLTSLLEAEGNVRLIDKISNVIIESNEIFYLKDKEEIYTKGESVAYNGADIQINAEEYFKYNKLTSLLEAKGNVKLDDRNKKVTIYTNEIFYLQNEEKVSTLGKTNINVKDKYNIEGYDLTLLRNQMILSSDKKATITDKNSNFYKLDQFQYSINEEILKGKKVNFTRNEKKDKIDKYFFETGFFDLKKNKFLGKNVNINFHKTLFDNEENDPRVSGVSGYGNELNTYIDKAVFTSCKKNDKCPPWKMRATNVQHDKLKKRIIYKNAWLDIYDFPVAYFPKFFHPDPSVKRQSGLLSPAIGDHNTLGDSVYLPYFFVISDDKDITIKPRLFNNGIRLLQTEYRQLTKNSLTIIDTSLTRGHDSSPTDRGDTRTHFFANSKIDLDFKKFINSKLEINYEKSSNDNYLKLFDFIRSPLLIGKNNSSLESSIRLNLEHENYDLTTSFEMYETLNGSSSDRYQYVLPYYDFSKNIDYENVNGSLSFNSSGNNTLSETNKLTSTVSNSLNYTSFDFFTDNGIKSNNEIILRNNNSMGNNSLRYKNSPQSELMGIYAYNASLPLKKFNENTIKTLVPKLSFIASPQDMKDHNSTGRRINVDNVFGIDRLRLGDSLEAGESLTLGIEFQKEKITNKDKILEIKEYFDFKLATVFRLNKEENIPINSTINEKTSNIFGQLNFKPNEIFSLKYDLSLTNDLSTFEYNSLTTKINFDKFSTEFNFLEERGIIGQSNVVTSTSEYNFDEYNSISFGTRRNRNLNLTEYYDLIYEYKNDCLIADIKYRKDYYNSGDIKPKEELFFSITIVPFYTYSPDKMILNKDRKD
jgi:LPS-assembly protein